MPKQKINNKLPSSQGKGKKEKIMKNIAIRIYNNTNKVYANEKLTKYINNVADMHIEVIAPQQAYQLGLSNFDPNNRYHIIEDQHGRQYIYRASYCDVVAA